MIFNRQTRGGGKSLLKIYWADVSGITVDAARPMSDYRRHQLETLRHDMSRRRALGAEYLLLEAIKEENAEFPLPPVIETDDFGKPYLRGGEFEFNLSHSDRFAACAISDKPVGLDIQTLSQCRESLVRRCFTEEEQDAVFSSKDPQETFTRIWCRKESFVKCLGRGLRIPLRSFDVSRGFTQDPDDQKDYAFAECRIGDLFFCVCMERDVLPQSIEPKKIALP